MPCSHTVNIETFDLHELIVCVSEDGIAEWLCSHTVDTETLALHELTVCVSEDVLSYWLYSHTEDIETFYPSSSLLILN